MSAQNIDDPHFNDQSAENADSAYDAPYEEDTAYSQDDSDEWADDLELSDEDDAEAAEAPPKKKTSNLTIGIILFVAIIGVFGFMILTGNKNSPPSSAVEAQMAMQAADADSPETQDVDSIPQSIDQGTGTQIDNTKTTSAPVAPPVTAAPQEGLMGNPDLLTQQTPHKDAAQPSASVQNVQLEPPPLLAEGAAAPAPTSAPEVKAPDTQPVPPAKDVVAAMTPTVKPVSDFPTVDSIKKPEAAIADSLPVPTAATPDVPAAPVAVVDSVPAVPAHVADNPSAQLQTQVDKAADKIAALEKQLVEKDSQLDAEKQKSAAAIAAAKAAPAEGTDTEVDELKARIAELETKLAAKATKPIKTVAPRHATVRKDRSSSADSSFAKKPHHAVSRQVVAKQWSLKSAGTGKAILADKSTGDLKTVRVGDSVAGLGRITGIVAGSAGWIVKGTAGSVTE